MMFIIRCCIFPLCLIYEKWYGVVELYDIVDVD
jgi:hypothetical protein